MQEAAVPQGQTDPVPVPEATNQREVMRRAFWGVIGLAGMLALIYWTSSPRPDQALGELASLPAEAEPADQAEAADDTAESEDESPPQLPTQEQLLRQPTEISVAISSLVDEQISWLRINGQVKPNLESSASASYRTENEFEVKTANVDRFVLELTHLPVNPTRRFILHIDGQDMLLFPRRAEQIELTRSDEGVWSYHPD